MKGETVNDETVRGWMFPNTTSIGILGISNLAYVVGNIASGTVLVLFDTLKYPKYRSRFSLWLTKRQEAKIVK